MLLNPLDVVVRHVGEHKGHVTQMEVGKKQVDERETNKLYLNMEKAGWAR